MSLPRLYAVTDERVLAAADLPRIAASMLEAGLRLLQARFKITPHDERVAIGRELRALTRRHGALLLANDSPELALEIEADGVHLGAGDAPVAAARALLGPDALIGVSGYDDPVRVRAFGPEEVAYLGVSSPYPSLTKAAKPTPAPERFPAVVRAARVPVYAIGGVEPEHVPGLLAAGCHGVAAVGSLFGAPDPAGAVRAFLERLG